jgi:hypothetical protein
MRNPKPVIAITMLASAAWCGTATARQTAPPAEGVARLETLIAGRTAGKPVYCLNQRTINSVEIVPGTALVYTAIGGTLYVNTPRAGAASLRKDQILVTNTYSGQLCNIDVVQLVDNASRFNEGSLILQEFVPYPKPRL